MAILEDPRIPCSALVREQKFAEAEALARQAVDDCKKAHGETSVIVAQCLATLGEVLVCCRKAREALDPLARAFHVLQTSAAERRRAAEALDWIGLAYEGLGEPRHAEKALLQGLHFREQAFGKAAPEIADSMDHLFHLYHDIQHDDAHAEEALRRGLQVLDGAGPEHLPHVVEELRALGRLYEDEARWELSVRAHDRAVRLRAQLDGAEAPVLGPMLRDLARAHKHAGDLKAAEWCLRRALGYVDGKHGGTPQRALPYVLELREILGLAGKVSEEKAMEELAAQLRIASIPPPAAAKA